MLRNHCIVEYYKYDISLIKPIQYICKLAYDILSVTHDLPDVKHIFTEDLLNEVRIDFSNLPDDISGDDAIGWLADQLAVYYGKKILINLDLKKSPILLVHQSSKILYVLNKTNRTIDNKERGKTNGKKDNIKHALLRLIKEDDTIRNIVNQLSNEKVRLCITNSLEIDNDGIYNETIVIKDTEVPFDVPYFYNSFLDSDLVTQDFLDTSDIWVNKDKFRKEFSIDIGGDHNISLIKSHSKEDIGICYNDYIFPLRPSSIEFIKNEQKTDFYWIQIKEVFKANDNKKNYDSDLIEDFKSRISNVNFTNLLSNLKENLYIETELLDNEKYTALKIFFTSTLKIDQVKYLKKLNFFINDSDNPASFGIYSFERLAEDASHFNLIHWFDKTKSGENYRYRDNLGPKKIEKATKVSTLKPEIAFYFITKYFEDFVQKILDKLQLEYLSNFHLYNGIDSLGEFDFLVKTKSTFYFIEVKTTLSKFYIKDYTSKCLKIIQAFKYLDVNLEFIIIGAYSNDTVEDLKHHIISAHKGYKKYNRNIVGSATIPYFFNVPIETTDKKMCCIAQSGYTELKSLLSKCLK